MFGLNRRSSGYIRAIVAAQMLAQIGAFALPALLPDYIERWTLSKTEAGWLVGIFFAAYVVMVPILVALTDRIPVRRVYLFGTGLTAKNSSRRISAKAATAATYDSPLAKKHHDTPAVAMTRPATAGPTTRADVNIALLKLTALLRCSVPTISATNARRAGLSIAFTAPRASAST